MLNDKQYKLLMILLTKLLKHTDEKIVRLAKGLASVLGNKVLYKTKEDIQEDIDF